MIEQLKTIREALAFLDARFGWSPGEAPAIDALRDALTQLEAMVGEQEPVAWCPALTYPGHEKDRAWANGKPRKEDIEYWKLNGKGITYAYAAPVAQQYEAGDMASASAQGFRDGVASVTQQAPWLQWTGGSCPLPDDAVFEYFTMNGEHHGPTSYASLLDWTHDYQLNNGDIIAYRRVAPVAQQPQAEKRCEYCDGTGDVHGFDGEWRGECHCCKQPQVEAVQYTRADLDRAYSAGLVEGERLAIQQAEAVPSDVVRDAAPIPDHELVTMYDERPTSDHEMIEFAREVERRHGIGVQPQHITDGSPCWCNPDVAYTDPETGASVIVHRRPQ